MAYLITTKGVCKQVSDLTLEKMQEMVGGYIQIVHTQTPENQVFVCDEDGKFKDYEINTIATYCGHASGAIADDDYFVGDVILAGRNEID